MKKNQTPSFRAVKSCDKLPEATGSSTIIIDWSKCVICQSRTSETLTCPLRSTKPVPESDDGYSRLAENFTEFKRLGSVPKILSISLDTINDGSGIENVLRGKEASWHKSCYRNFNSSRLARLTETSKRNDTNPKPSPKKLRSDTAPLQITQCCFCDRQATRTNSLFRACTTEKGKKILDGAAALRDGKLLAKLGGTSDTAAIDLHYHNTCMTHFNNQLRALERRKSSTDENSVADGIAFARLLSYIYEERRCAQASPVFRVSALTSLFEQFLLEEGVIRTGHSTRLRKRLLSNCVDLEELGSEGGEWKVAFKKDVSMAVASSCRDYETEGVDLTKAADIVRRSIFSMENDEQVVRAGSAVKQSSSIPNTLVALVRMIIFGPGSTATVTEDPGRTQAVLSIAQLIKFHTIKRVRSNSARARHNKANETPLTTYIALKVHGESRNKSLVNILHNLGLCISYDRLKTITTDIANEICSMYNRDKIVCPPGLKLKVFTTAAADNLDHNTTSNVAQDAFHGTAISINQHPTFENPGEERICTEEPQMKSRTMLPLPVEYTLVPPCIVNLKSSKCPVTAKQTRFIPGESDNVEEMNWVDQAAENSGLSWASYHSNFNRLEKRPPTVSAVLPLFTEASHSPAMMLHAMNVASQAIHHLNSTQTPVLVVDQPLFAICKQLQYCLPETHGEDKYVIMLGGLHIEQAALRMVGHWLQSSGWVQILADSEVTTVGKAEAAINVSHIKRARYMHEVTAAALYNLQKKAYSAYSKNGTLTFSEWHLKTREEQPQFQFWDIVLKLELSILTLVRSIREANFLLYVQCLFQILPWFFSLDHIHYARWLSVHARDLANLQVTHKDVYEAFIAGAFVGRKTTKAFSAMALDQIHEQLNATLKGDGGIIGLTSNSAALRRFIVSGPEVCRIIDAFEQEIPHSDPAAGNHHEGNEGFHVLEDMFKRSLPPLKIQGIHLQKILVSCTGWTLKLSWIIRL